MDANQLTIEKYLHDAGVYQLIHGHTHRPAIHQFEVDGKPAKRIVLGDWGDKPSYLIASSEGITLHDPRVE